jgi:hypothetical protein
MSQEKFFNRSESSRPDPPFCPNGHENPCAWSSACFYCEAICKREKEDEALLSLVRKNKEKGRVVDPDADL